MSSTILSLRDKHIATLNEIRDKLLLNGFNLHNLRCEIDATEEGLNDETLNFVMEQYCITRLQAEDLWNKVTSFNQILMNKYGDNYFDNANTILVLTQQYKDKVLRTYRK